MSGGDQYQVSSVPPTDVHRPFSARRAAFLGLRSNVVKVMLASGCSGAEAGVAVMG